MAKEKDEYLIKLTPRNTWICIVTFIGIIGSIFGAGIAVENWLTKVEIADLKIEQTEKIKTLNDTLGNKLRSAELDCEFFKKEYQKTNSRLTICLKDGEFTEFVESTVSPE